MRRSSQPRATTPLSKSLDQSLCAYALAAGSAGVGLLALAPPAEAKIIYTPAHAKVGIPLPVDLNHDGIVDFYLVSHYGRSSTKELSVCQYWRSYSAWYCVSYRGANAVRTSNSKGREYAAALRYGDKVQRGGFAKPKATLGTVLVGTGTDTNWRGPWFNGGKGVKHRYLGLKFKIKGRFHFGWARMSVTTDHRYFTAILTGYAYETTPDKGIIAGKTKGPDVTTVEPASLGHLAAGASAIPAWRSEK